MEFNEISMCMDVKLDIYDKRPDSLKFKAWSKCQVKIEAIKCLPCFLRIKIRSVAQYDEDDSAQLSVSVNVPGVTLSLVASRTKQHSYGLFWTHNRRKCFIYFAMDTEFSCRRHMKWIKKSIKNLELYRQVFLEQRRNSRGNGVFSDVNKKVALSCSAVSALGPLPRIPDSYSNVNWSRRVSRASDMYEEILEGNVFPPLSRRLSRTSIASGIYEEMKPCSTNIQAIVEEQIITPPPLPPLPPHRKRLNTFESDLFGIYSDIPRSNTNPESEFVKKKKYRNLFDNIVDGGRSKRSESVSETPACTMEDVINDGSSVQKPLQSIYANEVISKTPCVKPSKRNSFSSPDLSKINLLETFDEDKLAALLQLNCSSDLDAHVDDDFDGDGSVTIHNCSSQTLNELALVPTSSMTRISHDQTLKLKSGSMESLNISVHLPQNFNFSACNTSSINLVGASGALPSTRLLKQNKIVLEDELTGYCLMAPIITKKLDVQLTATPSTTSSTTSGYSTGSCCSSTSSTTSTNNLVAENKNQQCAISQIKPSTAATIDSFYDELPLRKTPLPVAEFELSNIYENVQTCSPINDGIVTFRNNEVTPTFSKDLTGNLYENLLTIKAAQELEQHLPTNICTSTPTDSPADKQSLIPIHEQENVYQTPRKSIISVDDKIPSYYPNSCDTLKMRRRSNSLSKHTTTSSIKSVEKENSSLNIKMKCERKENLYMSSPQKILDQRNNPSTNFCAAAKSSTSKSKNSANAQKISENVYTVNLLNKKSIKQNNNNAKKSPYKDVNEAGQLQEKLHNELLQLALLQKIDFKFDDMSTTSTTKTSPSVTTTITPSDSHRPTQSGIEKLEQAELEYENCYQATKDATRLLHTYATLAPNQSVRMKQQLQHHLQLNQSPNQKLLMTQSTKLDSPETSTAMTASTGGMSAKKFASLPRFKKIDLSPLKLKINNVLQRNNQNTNF